MLRIGPLEYLRRLGDQFDELAADLDVSALGVLMHSQVAAQLLPLLLELVPSLPEEVLRDEPMKAIVIQPVHEDLLLFDLGPDFLDDSLVVRALFLATLGDAVEKPRLRLLRDGDARQKSSDLLVELFLADVGLAAGLIAGAVVVDVALLLDLRREVSAARATNQQTLVCEVVFAVNGLLVGAEGRLDRIPDFPRDQGLVAAGPDAALPAERAVIERVLEQPLQLAETDELALLRGGQSFIAQLVSQRFQRVGARGVELVGAADHRCLDGVWDDGLPIAFADVAVTERCLVGKPTLLDLLRHALLDLVGQVVDVVLRQEHHHPEGELSRRVVGEVLLPEQGLRRQLVDGQVVAQVAAEAIDLLADDGAEAWILASGLNHSRELATTGLFRRLDVNELLDDLEAVALGVLVNALQLNWDRVAFTLLLLR